MKKGAAIFWSRAGRVMLAMVATLTAGDLFGEARFTIPEFAPGVAYTNYQNRSVPWSIHVARASRASGDLEIRSVHARGKALGLSRLSDMIKSVPADQGRPVFGLNGDFYVRERSYAGDPRGLQIVDGSLLSRPIGRAGFWVDTNGTPNLANVQAEFEVQWPDGSKSPFGINEERIGNSVVLYTPDIGRSTQTIGGVEFLLERAGEGPWLPLLAGVPYRARVSEIRPGGNSEVPSGKMVLSLGGNTARALVSIKKGAEILFSTATSPTLAGVKTAIGGGPILLRRGQKERMPDSAGRGGYEFRSMTERHPRSAVGWNEHHFFLVEVDGRQELSAGMTLSELSDFMLRLGCTDAMNLDGGGSATFWCDGKVRNSPCDNREREIANAVLLVRREVSARKGPPLDRIAEPVGRAVKQ